MNTEFETHFKQEALRYNIPEYMIEGLANFVFRGTPAGSFLTAVLCNDLKKACSCADDTNKHHIWDYVNFCYNKFPGNSWGSPEAYEQWITAHQKEAA